MCVSINSRLCITKPVKLYCIRFFTGPSSTTFDITLMILLLKHLLGIRIVDQLQDTIKLDDEAALSIIKYYRNRFVHKSDSDFMKKWDQISAVS